MHVAASDPRFASRGEVTPAMSDMEKEIARAQAAAAGTPANVVERIAEGKVEQFYQGSVRTEERVVKGPERPSGASVGWPARPAAHPAHRWTRPRAARARVHAPPVGPPLALPDTHGHGVPRPFFAGSP